MKLLENCNGNGSGNGNGNDCVQLNRAARKCHEAKAQVAAGRSGELNELEMHLACMTLGMGKANGQEHSCCCSY